MGTVLGARNLAVLEYDLGDAHPRFLELIAGTEPPLCRTESGKHHAYFDAVNSVTKAARDGLELRVGAHQCVVPPSTHPDTGEPYVWERAPWDVPLPPDHVAAYFAAAAAELRERLQSDPDARVTPGQRRARVFRLACSLVARGVPPDAILTTARAFNEAPLPDGQIVDQVDGAVVRYDPATALRPGAAPCVPRGPHLQRTVATDGLRVVEAADFAAVREASAEPLLGDSENTILARGGDAAWYGDGGAGKTTLGIDRACHLCAGRDWLGLPVPHPVRALWIENEGPRGKFREKLDAWDRPAARGTAARARAPVVAVHVHGQGAPA